MMQTGPDNDETNASKPEAILLASSLHKNYKESINEVIVNCIPGVELIYIKV